MWATGQKKRDRVSDSCGCEDNKYRTTIWDNVKFIVTISDSLKKRLTDQPITIFHYNLFECILDMNGVGYVDVKNQQIKTVDFTDWKPVL